MDARVKPGHDGEYAAAAYLLIGKNPAGIISDVFCSSSKPDSLMARLRLEAVLLVDFQVCLRVTGLDAIGAMIDEQRSLPYGA